MSDLTQHLTVLYIDWAPTVCGLQSRATDFGSGRPLTCALHRLEACSLGAYSLARPTLDLADHLLVRYKGYRGSFNVNIV